MSVKTTYNPRELVARMESEQKQVLSLSRHESAPIAFLRGHPIDSETRESHLHALAGDVKAIMEELIKSHEGIVFLNWLEERHDNVPAYILAHYGIAIEDDYSRIATPFYYGSKTGYQTKDTEENRKTADELLSRILRNYSHFTGHFMA